MIALPAEVQFDQLANILFVVHHQNRRPCHYFLPDRGAGPADKDPFVADDYTGPLRGRRVSFAGMQNAAPERREKANPNTKLTQI
jgi:hypothetical protein